MNDSTMREKARKILVVEDTATVAELIREMMLCFGHEVEVCITVEAALAAFEQDKFDLVITDYTMPGMNGVEFAHVIRKRLPGQPIMLITGSAYSIADNAAGQLPVNAILQKPFSVMEFQQAVNGLFAGDQTPATTRG